MAYLMQCMVTCGQVCDRIVSGWKCGDRMVARRWQGGGRAVAGWWQGCDRAVAARWDPCRQGCGKVECWRPVGESAMCRIVEVESGAEHQLESRRVGE